MINVHSSLRSGAEIPFEFVRLDPRPRPVAATVWATPRNVRNPDPGTGSARFLIAVSIPASELEPGVYMVRIPPESMLEENLLSNGNGFPSDNPVAVFVVTPRVAGSTSRLLWLHDSLTGVAYGSFAGQSIYPTRAGAARTVNYLRPGLDRSASWSHGNLPFLRRHGYEFEHVDLAAAPPSYLDAYDLVCCVGQFEYMPNEVITQLADFQSGGGNVYTASHEFGIFRVHLNPARHTLTTYKWDDVNEDPST